MRISLFPVINSNMLSFTTLCSGDYQFYNSKQIRWSAALVKLLVCADGNTRVHIRSSDMSFVTKFLSSSTGIDSDLNNIYGTPGTSLQKRNLSSPFSTISSLVISSTRMIDASGDPENCYVTCNNATFHGVKKIRKSDMTEVASIGGAAGSGDGQFNNPLGVKYYGGYVYVCDVDNKRIVKLNASDLSFVSVVATSAVSSFYDCDCDGSYWYVAVGSYLYKKDMSFADLSPAKYVSGVNAYSLCIIPDQGEGYATLAITDPTNNHIARYRCDTLEQVGSDVGSSGTGADTLCDPQVTGPVGVWHDSEGSNYVVASAANISKNGFSGDFFRQAPNVMRYSPNTGGLAAITAIDFSDDKIIGEIRNLYRCTGLTSVKLQTNPYIVLNFGRLPSVVTTLWAYSCASSVFGSIKHMVGLASLNVRENGYSQAQVDQLIDDIWQLRASHAVCTVNINGSNAAPSGTYQSAETPSTGKEKIYDLINNYGYDITYTA